MSKNERARAGASGNAANNFVQKLLTVQIYGYLSVRAAALTVEQVLSNFLMIKQNSSRRWKVSEFGKLELVSVTKLT